jgi:hypothetical protein
MVNSFFELNIVRLDNEDKIYNDEEKRLYQYFCQAYKAQGGQLQTLGWSSICQVRKDRIERHISDEEQAESFERLLASIA